MSGRWRSVYAMLGELASPYRMPPTTARTPRMMAMFLARRTNRFRAPCFAFTFAFGMNRLLYGENRA